jgi:hypothetical protein
MLVLLYMMRCVWYSYRVGMSVMAGVMAVDTVHKSIDLTLRLDRATDDNKKVST